MLEGTLSGYIRNLGGLVGYQEGLGVRLGNAEPLSSKNLERKPTTASLDLSPPGSIRCRTRGGNDTASAANTPPDLSEWLLIALCERIGVGTVCTK